MTFDCIFPLQRYLKICFILNLIVKLDFQERSSVVLGDVFVYFLFVIHILLKLIFLIDRGIILETAIPRSIVRHSKFIKENLEI